MKKILHTIALILALAMFCGNAKILSANEINNNGNGLKITIDVKVLDNIDGNATQVEANFTKAFRNLGVVVVDNDSADTTAITITCGKDDDDDDNDGITDDKDKDDDGDGEDDSAEEVEVIDLDEVAGNLTDDFVDTDKSSGIFFEFDGEDGIDIRFESSADSLKEAATGGTGMASTLFGNNSIFQKASFSPISNSPVLPPSADCLRQKMALRAALARCKDAACKNDINAKMNSLGCL